MAHSVVRERDEAAVRRMLGDPVGARPQVEAIVIQWPEATHDRVPGILPFVVCVGAVVDECTPGECQRLGRVFRYIMTLTAQGGRRSARTFPNTQKTEDGRV